MPSGQHRALEGLKVLEIAEDTVSFCGKLLTGLGARVLLVEPPGSQRVASDPSSLYLHAGKSSITLDLAHPQGRELFLRLVAESDALLEGLPPGALEQLDLSYDTLKSHNARLILVSISGFGQDGPHSQRRSDPLVAAATGGWTYLSGSTEGPPLSPPGKQPYYLGALHGALGVLLALRKNRGRENGEHLDISLQECVASSLDHALARHLSEGIIPKRQGNAHWNQSFFVLPCRDGYIHLTPFQQWETLVEWMDGEGMAADLTDEKYRDAQCRLDHLPHVLGVISRWSKTHGKEELFETARLMRFPWAPVCSLPETLASPQLAARGFWHTNSEMPELKFPGTAVHQNESQATSSRLTPAPGQDNSAVFGRQLGLPPGQLEELKNLGVI